MDKQDYIEVPLSKTSTSVILPTEQGKTLEILMSSRKKWVKFPDLLDAGVRDPKSAIEALKEYGVRIETIIKDACSKNYELFEDAPHYKYHGWCMNLTTAENLVTQKEVSI